MDVITVDGAYVIRACIALTQRNSPITEDSWRQTQKEISALATGWYNAGNTDAAAIAMNFQDGRKRGFNPDWEIV